MLIFIGHLLGLIVLLLLLVLWKLHDVVNMMDDGLQMVARITKFLSDENNREKVIQGFSDHRCNHTPVEEDKR